MASAQRKLWLPFSAVRRAGVSSFYVVVAFILGGTYFLNPASMAGAEASQAGGAGQSLKVNVGIAAAKPGDPIDIPVTLSAPEQVQVQSLTGHISFPRATLSYTEVERGLAVDLADGEAKGVLQEDKNDSTLSILELSISGKEAIRPGILAYLKFRVSPDAQKGIVPLKLVDMKATMADGGPVQLAKGDDGEITLFATDEQIPVVGCFFFTH